MLPYFYNLCIPGAKHPRHQLRIIIWPSPEVPWIRMLIIAILKHHVLKIIDLVTRVHRFPIQWVNHMYPLQFIPTVPVPVADNKLPIKSLVIQHLAEKCLWQMTYVISEHVNAQMSTYVFPWNCTSAAPSMPMSAWTGPRARHKTHVPSWPSSLGSPN